MDTGLCIRNMLVTRQGEHCMFRSFGLGAVTDRVGRIRRSDIVSAVTKWYPQVTEINVTQNDNGEYNIAIKGADE